MKMALLEFSWDCDSKTEQNLLNLRNVSDTNFIRRSNVVEFSCTIEIKVLAEKANS